MSTVHRHLHCHDCHWVSSSSSVLHTNALNLCYRLPRHSTPSAHTLYATSNKDSQTSDSRSEKTIINTQSANSIKSSDTNIISDNLQTKQSSDNDSNNDINRQQNSQDWETQLSFDYFVPDLLAIVLACQLLGLSDALQSEAFARGGWVQPVTLNSFRSIPLLLQRFSIDTILWFAGVALTNARPISSLAKSVNRSSKQPNKGRSTGASSDTASGFSLLGEWGPVPLKGSGVLSFIGLRVLTATLLLLLSSGSSASMDESIWEQSIPYALQEAYYVVILVGAVRTAAKRHYG
jgi:hypothetical protein